MNAAKAREIVAHSGPCKCIGHSKEEIAKAQGYLLALEGPEVKALVEALEKYTGFAIESTFWADEALQSFREDGK